MIPSLSDWSTAGASLRSAGKPLAPAPELAERLRPVVLRQPRQRPVGEQTAFGVVGRAVVHLVLAMYDPLYRRPAARAGLAEPTLHGHAVVKGRHLLRKFVGGFDNQPIAPFVQRVL